MRDRDDIPADCNGHAAYDDVPTPAPGQKLTAASLLPLYATNEHDNTTFLRAVADARLAEGNMVLYNPTVMRRFALMRTTATPYFKGIVLGHLREWLPQQWRDWERDLPHLATPEAAKAYPVITSMDAVTAQPIAWLWYPYIAFGKLHVLDGDPGVGKSLLMLQIAASLSRGYPLPDQSGKPTLSCGDPATTLLIATEDGLADTVKPRLERAGADCSRIKNFNDYIGDDLQSHTFTLQHMDMLTEAMETLHPRLIIIDAIQAVLGEKVDTNRANQVKAVLDPLARLAEAYQCAIVCIRHPSKPGQNIAKLIHRGLGSQAFIGSARLGLFVDDHPSDSTKVLLVQSKSNAGDIGRTQVFSKRGGQFEWCGISRLTKEMMAGSGKGPSPQAFLEACFWLEDRLKDGRAYAAADIQEEMKDAGFSHGVIFAAKRALQVAHTKTSVGTFTWHLPPVTTPSSSSSSSSSSTSSTSYSSLKTTAYRDASPHGDVPDETVVDDVYEVDGVVTSAPCEHEHDGKDATGQAICLDCGEVQP